MAELIRKQSAIDALNMISDALYDIDIPFPTVPEYIEHHEKVQSVMALVMNLKESIKGLTPVSPTRLEWTPCDEGLPETRDAGILSNVGISEVSDMNLITIKKGRAGIVRTAWLQDGKWHCDLLDLLGYENPSYKVTAWMPLPDPYEGGKE